VVVQQIHFDQDGYKTKEISFIEGYPDLITAWGWFDGKRVKSQSAVNYPGRDGPQASRAAIVSGAFPLYEDEDSRASKPKFGNRIESDLDATGRPLTRRRYSDNGSLVYVESFRYTDNAREIKPVDSAGGFIGSVREVFDKEHNVIEIHVLSDNGSVAYSTHFEYLFDKRRNWIEKRELQTRSLGKKPTKKIVGTIFRDILYYDETPVTNDVALSIRPAL
jgi:hypothetical protein